MKAIASTLPRHEGHVVITRTSVDYNRKTTRTRWCEGRCLRQPALKTSTPHHQSVTATFTKYHTHTLKTRPKCGNTDTAFLSPSSGVADARPPDAHACRCYFSIWIARPSVPVKSLDLFRKRQEATRIMVTFLRGGEPLLLILSGRAPRRAPPVTVVKQTR